MKLGLSALAGMLAASIALTASAQAETLKASHQFPGGKGDARDEMVQLFAKELAAADVGLDVQVYPGQSLYKAKEQWGALTKGQLDITSFPLDYASGRVPQFSATLMPGLVRNHDRAKRLNASPFMTDIKKLIEDNGAIVIADAWLGGAFASKKNCITSPDSDQGSGDARRRSRLRADAGRRRRLDLVDGLVGNLHRHADRRARCHQHLVGFVRLLPPL